MDMKERFEKGFYLYYLFPRITKEINVSSKTVIKDVTFLSKYQMTLRRKYQMTGSPNCDSRNLRYQIACTNSEKQEVV